MTVDERVHAELPILDEQYLSEVSEGDVHFEKELFHDFFDLVPELISSLEKGIEENDADQAHRAAHSLRGSARCIGAKRVGIVCDSLVMKAREGDLSNMNSLLEQLRKNIAELKSFIEKEWGSIAA
ncbi:MAG TPA: Hpt domain-containing protein [Fimbriimonadales bacterium]|nr:Hpt domain-containing protein [Fimbriimonadales bacterium]